jgi:hypothetical protein
MSIQRTNRFWAVSLDLILFLDFLKLFVYMHLGISFTDPKLWVLENFRRSLGRAGMCWSQPTRIDHMCKNMWIGGRNFFLQGGSLGHPCRASGQPTVFHRLWASPCHPHFFGIFGFFFYFSFWSYEEVWMGLPFWKNGCTTPPFIEACLYTWKGVIFHSSRNLEIIFFLFFFPNLEYT